jgi:hypothetical protein
MGLNRIIHIMLNSPLTKAQQQLISIKKNLFFVNRQDIWAGLDWYLVPILVPNGTKREIWSNHKKNFAVNHCKRKEH